MRTGSPRRAAKRGRGHRRRARRAGRRARTRTRRRARTSCRQSRAMSRRRTRSRSSRGPINASARAIQIRRRTCVAVGEARPQRDEQRREILDQQGDRQSRAGEWRGSRTTGRRRGRRSRTSRHTGARGASGGGARAQSAPGSPRARRRAPRERTWASRSDESPVVRIVFETAPLIAPEHRRDRRHQIAEPRTPVAGRRRETGPRSRIRSYPHDAPTLRGDGT